MKKLVEKFKEKSLPYEVLTEKGQAALVTIVVILAAAAFIVAAVGILTFNEIKKINNVVKSTESFYVAEAGAEDALLRVKNAMNYNSTYTLSVGNGSATIDITGPLDNLTITSKGSVDGRFRKIAINMNATPSSNNASFNYGVHVGAGGLEMAGNSQIIGNVYSNGPAVGDQNHPVINGDMFSAGPSGSIDRFDVVESSPGAGDGDAHANTITNSNMDGSAFCQTGSGNNKACDTSQTDPEVVPLPITDGQITTWKNQAAAGGTAGSTVITGGSTLSLGPKKVNGDLTVNSNATLIITGIIHVTGNVTINSNSLVYLHSSFGTDSGLILADGLVFIDSNVTVCGSNGGTIGSCNASNDSYVMFLSTNTSLDSSNPAIDMHSNTTLTILYAHAGLAVVNSNTSVFEITAYKLEIKSNATVTYISGLASVDFSSGPGGTFTINSWLEVT